MCVSGCAGRDGGVRDGATARPKHSDFYTLGDLCALGGEKAHLCMPGALSGLSRNSNWAWCSLSAAVAAPDLRLLYHPAPSLGVLIITSSDMEELLDCQALKGDSWPSCLSPGCRSLCSATCRASPSPLLALPFQERTTPTTTGESRG